MQEIELGAIQLRFADLVWAHEPVTSGELVRLCEQQLNWKKPTTYTVLRKLCEKGLLQNENGVVTARIPREEFYAARSEQIVTESFQGSLPAFVAAFVARRNLTAAEAEEIQRLIDHFKKEGQM